MTNEDETVRVVKPTKQETLRSLELELLQEGFMPTTNNVSRLQLYATYYKNMYEAAPIQAAQTKILYKCMYEVLTEQISRYEVEE